jgi:hypothetical protein
VFEAAKSPTVTGMSRPVLRAGADRRRRTFRVPKRVSAFHIIFIGHVERYAYTLKPTLLFCRGKYMRGEPLIPT